MTDSDNTTTLPRVTRWRLIEEMAVAFAGCWPKAIGLGNLSGDQFDDRAVAVWLGWRAVWEEVELLVRRQQFLERKIIEVVGAFSATEDENVAGNAPFQERLDPASEHASVQVTGEVHLAARRVHWNAVNWKIGYSSTLQAEHKAAERAGDLLRVLTETPAASLAGVAAKLDAVLTEGQPSEDYAEFPWPQIRLAFEDIIRIGQRTIAVAGISNAVCQSPDAEKKAPQATSSSVQHPLLDLQA